MRPQAPKYRPTWVLILSSVMMLSGGYALVSGLLKVRDPIVVLTVGINESSDTEADVQLARRLAAARAAAVSPHRNRVRTEAVLEIGLALFTLYATAAVLSRDRNGRALALAVAALGIAYQVGTLPVYLSLMHDYGKGAGDLLAEAVLQSAGGASSSLTAAEIARRVRSAMIGGPIVVAVAGIAGSIVLLAFFGGRRGRVLYGLDLPPTKKPSA